MKQKTNTPSEEITNEAVLPAVSSVVGQDLRNAALIVSVLLNLVIFISWLVLQVTTQYDVQVANFLFNR